MNAERLTSILPQLRHYRRLKIIANFAAAGSLESVLGAATAAICRALGATAGQYAYFEYLSIYCCVCKVFSEMKRKIKR
jgi:hypothetical protein